jgi:predicted nucleic acid-binding protein
MSIESGSHVVDANIVAAWTFDLPWSSAAAELRHPLNWLIAPELIIHEVGNTIWKNIRAGAIDLHGGQGAYRAVEHLVDLVPSIDLRFDALKMASDLNHPIYDCFYLALAVRRQLPLVTADRKMASHAADLGIAVEHLS